MRSSAAKRGAICLACPHFDGTVPPAEQACGLTKLHINQQVAGGTCPLGSWDRPGTDVAEVVVRVPGPAATHLADPADRAAETGRRLWAELHRYAARPGFDLYDALRWLERWGRQIPCGDCRRHWLAACEANPPALTDGKFFGWTVDAHNAVNRRLDKPEVTVEQARLIWAAPSRD